MGKHKEVFGWITAGIANTATAVTQTHAVDEFLYTATLVVGLIAGVLSIMYSGYKWFNRATSSESPGGKKITIEEIKEGFEEIKEVAKNANKDKQ